MLLIKSWDNYNSVPKVAALNIFMRKSVVRYLISQTWRSNWHKFKYKSWYQIAKRLFVLLSAIRKLSHGRASFRLVEFQLADPKIRSMHKSSHREGALVIFEIVMRGWIANRVKDMFWSIENLVRGMQDRVDYGLGEYEENVWEISVNP